MPALLLLFALAALCQEPVPALQPGEVARWDGGHLSQEEFEAHLGRRLRRQSLGLEALRHLLQIDLVERSAAERGLHVPAGALAQRLAQAKDEIERAGHDFDQFLAARGLSTAELEKLLGDSLLHEMLARQDLGRADGEPVSNEELQQWTERHLATLLAQSPSAPEGFVLNAPPFVIDEQELGRTLRSALGREQLRGYVHDYVLAQQVAAWADGAGVELTDALLEQELAFQSAKADESGVSLEALLGAMGTSTALVRESAPFRTTVLLTVLARQRYDEAWFAARPPAEIQGLHERFGARRQVSCLLLRAVEQKVDPLDLSFAEAEEELIRLAAGAGDAARFGELAAQHSEDEISRLRRGSLGWIQRRDPRVDPALAAAAFAAPLGQVHGPVRTAQGMSLLLVTAEEPAIGEDAFRERVRRGLLGDLRAELVSQSRLRTIYD